eukprot:gene20194-688_t
MSHPAADVHTRWYKCVTQHPFAKVREEPRVNSRDVGRIVVAVVEVVRSGGVAWGRLRAGGWTQLKDEYMRPCAPPADPAGGAAGANSGPNPDAQLELFFVSPSPSPSSSPRRPVSPPSL